MQKPEIEKLVEALLEQESAELVDLRFAKEGPKWVLRVFVDKQPKGVTLDDCAYFSDRIGSLLDSQNAIDRGYVLEVSSPGLDRVVKKPRDFERFAGKHVKVRLKFAENNQRNFHGVLIGYINDKVVIEDEQKKRFEFPLPSIDEARLDYHGEI
jgi:ribosome maturation factor RimP